MDYTIHLGEKNSHYPSNEISTTKYNLLSYFPKVLFSLFSRIANCFFLLVSIFISFPGVAPLSPLTVLIPFFFVVLVTFIKETVEDLKRRKNDRLANSSPVLVWEDKEWRQTKSKNLRAGDIVKVEENQTIPADLLLLTSSSVVGECKLHTSSLDGESNLKTKHSLKSLKPFFEEDKIQDLAQDKAQITTDDKDFKFNLKVSVNKPSASMHYFEGFIEIDGEKEPVDIKNFLWRGSSLKNTNYIVGAVIYPGPSSKIMLNKKNTPFKLTRYDRMLNYIVLIMLVFEVFFSLLLPTLSFVFIEDRENAMYIEKVHYEDDGMIWFTDFMTYFILLNGLIPLSLVVSMEIVKLLRYFTIQLDINLYDESSNRPIKVQNFNSLEDLGLIDYVFTDKTGTLTSNNMQFRAFSIGKNLYEEQALSEIDTKGADSKFNNTQVSNLFRDLSQKRAIDALEFPTVRIDNQSDLIQEFFKALLLCNELEIEKDNLTGSSVFVGNSPDEITLANASKSFGFFLQKRSPSSITLSFDQNTFKYKVLALNEFSSERKRMSIVVKDLSDDSIRVYAKGADSAIYKLIGDAYQPFLESTMSRVKEFSERGLRTLLVGLRSIDTREFEEWEERYKEAKTSGDEKKEEIVKRLVEEIEEGLTIVGATGLEDKLEEGVEDTIEKLRRGGIKVWMITGDKLETAQTIGRCSGLIEEDWNILTSIESRNQFPLSTKNPEIARDSKVTPIQLISTHNIPNLQATTKNAQIEQKYGQVLGIFQQNSQNLDHTDISKIFHFNTHSRISTNNSTNTALIIEGEEFLRGLEDPKSLLEICSKCTSVIICRAAPLVKAEAVKFIKKYTKSTTLAIGDGGNDVAMIQAADIGIGIFGKEGLQAANSSDIGLGKFRLLEDLLFVHGRWMVLRMGTFILYFFYKSAIYVIPQILFSFHNGFSGQTVFEDWSIGLYNLMVSSIGAITYAIFYQDINPRLQPKLIENMPLFYKETKNSDPLTLKSFGYWLLFTVYSAFIVFYIPLIAYYGDIVEEHGKTAGMWTVSICRFTGMVFSIIVVLIIEIERFSIIETIGLALPTLLYFPGGFFVLDEAAFTPYDGEGKDALGTIQFWTGVLAVVVMIYLPCYAIRTWRRLFQPSLASYMSVHYSKTSESVVIVR